MDLLIIRVALAKFPALFQAAAVAVLRGGEKRLFEKRIKLKPQVSKVG